MDSKTLPCASDAKLPSRQRRPSRRKAALAASVGCAARERKSGLVRERC